MSTTNHKILIAHEVPISMLRYIEGKTDYQYALVHLFKNEAYNSYFRDFIKRDGRVILDNSLFELGTMFDAETFAEAVNDIRPAEYIIPDAFNDADATMKSASDWMQKYKDLPGRKIGVLQGKDWADLRDCYNHMVRVGVDKIAINFNPLKMDKQDIGHWGVSRFSFLRYIYDEYEGEGIKMPLHLLGCSLPQEFEIYKSAPFRSYIETIDTSNPVLLGLQGTEYNSWGRRTKPSDKMNDFMEADYPNTSTLEIIDKNIDTFKNFVNGPSV